LNADMANPLLRRPEAGAPNGGARSGTSALTKLYRTRTASHNRLA